MTHSSEVRFQRLIIVIVLVAVTVLFFAMIRGFLVTILMAAIFSGLAHPIHRRLTALFRGREGWASALVVILFLLLVVGPLLFMFTLIAGQALRVSASARPWISSQLADPARLDQLLQTIPGARFLEPYRNEILTRAGELVGTAGSFLFSQITSTTRNTIAFLFQFFLFLYTMYFLLKDGVKMLRRIREFLPLPVGDQERMLDKFTSVTRATLRGTLLIGLAQGTLAGIAFAVAGIEGALFWGTVMTCLSVVPGVGTAAIWIPASAMLFLMGRVGAAVGLALFCALIVGTIDNILRPRLVGEDTRLHPLLILFSTMGGLAFFGFSGFIVGPILAALFVTVWDMFGVAFRTSIDHARGAPQEE